MKITVKLGKHYSYINFADRSLAVKMDDDLETSKPARQAQRAVAEAALRELFAGREEVEFLPVGAKS